MLTLVLLASALTCLIFVLVFGSFFGGIGSARYAATQEYAALLDLIEKMYIGEYDESDVTAAAMHAAVIALGDEWSYYMTPEEYIEYLNSANNQFAGIGVGVAIDEETGGMVVIYTYRGSPAETAGLLPGDIITGIDGQGLEGLSLDGMRALLSRPVGQTASLTVIRADGVVEAVDVVFDLVFSDPVSFEMLDGDIGYVRIDNFERGAADGFISAVNELLEEGARAFIYDVRCNRGGRVNELIRILDFLLPEGEIFISVDKSGKESITYSDDETVDAPAIVLADKYSFSAAEYFAAMLGEFDYAEVVGERTTGKGRSQMTEMLPGGGALHISTSQYLTKNRISLHDAGGLIPDHQLAMSDEEISLLLVGNLDKDEDPQLQLALELINDLLTR